MFEDRLRVLIAEDETRQGVTSVLEGSSLYFLKACR
jgi:hypothetical protein